MNRRKLKVLVCFCASLLRQKSVPESHPVASIYDERGEFSKQKKMEKELAIVTLRLRCILRGSAEEATCKKKKDSSQCAREKAEINEQRQEFPSSRVFLQV